MKCILTINSQLVPTGVQSLAQILTRETEYPSSFKSGSLGDMLNQNFFFPSKHPLTYFNSFLLIKCSWPLNNRDLVYANPLRTWLSDWTTNPLRRTFFKVNTTLLRAFPGGSDGKESTCNVGDLCLIPESERSPGKGNGYSLQYFGLENSLDRGSWWATIHGVAKSQTWLST